MRKAILIGLVILPLLALPACSHDAEAPPAAVAPKAELTAQDEALAMRAAIPEIAEVFEITEDNNDKNNLIGRPKWGYVAASILVDIRASGEDPQCVPETPGIECGATIEQWPNPIAAQRRADYIVWMDQQTPAKRRKEWTTVSHNLVLRVSGKFTPLEAKEYQAAFTGIEASKSASTTHWPTEAALEQAAHNLDLLASGGNVERAFEYYSQRCRDMVGGLDGYRAFLEAWKQGRNPQYESVTVRVTGSSGQVVSIDNDPSAPPDSMNPRAWSFIDGKWQFDNC